MSESARLGQQLLCELHDVAGRYKMAKSQLSATRCLRSGRRCGDCPRT